MDALVYTATEEVTFRQEAAPNPRPGDAVVRVETVGICGSDMHAYHGKDARRVPPLILGHEACGTVTEGKHRGRRVVLNPLIACGDCRHCRAGRTNLCQSRELIGLRLPGAFAEFVTIPEQNVMPIDDDMDPVRAALTEPAATALHALTMAERALARPVFEARALVIGAGSIGLLSALFLKAKGCREIWIADTNPLRRETAAAADCARVFDPLQDPGPGEDACDLVVDAVGSGPSRASASGMASPGGVISHIGLLDGEAGLDIRKLTLSEITFLGHYTYTPTDLQASIDALHRGALGSCAWVETRGLSDGAAAFRDLHEGRTAAAKIVLKPGR